MNVRNFVDRYRSKTDQKELFTRPKGRVSIDALRGRVRNLISEGNIVLAQTNILDECVWSQT